MSFWPDGYFTCPSGIASTLLMGHCHPYTRIQADKAATIELSKLLQSRKKRLLCVAHSASSFLEFQFYSHSNGHSKSYSIPELTEQEGIFCHV